MKGGFILYLDDLINNAPPVDDDYIDNFAEWIYAVGEIAKKIRKC